MIDASIFDRHARIAFSFSGGKDSIACLYLLREYLPRMTVYHIDTGDTMPETREIVDKLAPMIPHFVRLQSNVLQWIAHNGVPSDLAPCSGTWMGVAAGMAEERISQRFDCCFNNIMRPLYERIRADGNTVIIRGTRADDIPQSPTKSGDVVDGVEMYYPIEAWTTAQVYEYLDSVGAPISRVYKHGVKSPECAACSAWWSDKRAAYLREFHPTAHLEFTRRTGIIVKQINPLLEQLQSELSA